MDENLNLAGNTEIEKALKEFEAKSSEEKQKELEVLKTSPTPQKEVYGIKFETDDLKQSVPSFESDIPKMVQLVMKWFGFEEQKQAEYVLLGFVVIVIIVSLFLVMSGGSSVKGPIPNGTSLTIPG